MKYLLVFLGLLATVPWAAAARIHGQVVDLDKDPINKVKLQLFRDDNVGKPLQTIHSDSEGKFVFENLEPGVYVIIASKRGWHQVKQNVRISYQSDEPEIRLSMYLTPLYKVMVSLHFSSLLYLLLFGYLILLFNFTITSTPAKAVTIAGWIFIAFSIFIGFFRLKWSWAFGLAFAGLPLPILLTRWGNKVATEKLAKEEQRLHEIEDEQQQHLQTLNSYIGQSALTTSDLKPYGEAKINGEAFEVKSLSGFIACGTKVVVRRIEAGKLAVEAESNA